MPHLAIDASPIGGGWSGDEAMVRGMVDGVLATCRAGDRISIVARDGVDLPDSVLEPHLATDVEVIRIRSGRGLRRLTVDLPRAVRALEARPDVLASHVHAPLGSGCRSALTITDLTWLHHPEYFPAHVRARLRALVPRQARQAAAVLTTTHSLADVVVADLSVDEERVHVVPTPVPTARRLAPEAEGAAAAWAIRQGLTRPFLISTGHAFDSRDQARLIYAFLEAQRNDARLRGSQLVLVGAAGFFDEAVGNATMASPDGTVIRMGRVSADHRIWLLQHAEALVYPALFEGLGLPALEAMAYGVPVIASSMASMPELVGDAAICVDPMSGDELAAAIGTVMTDSDLRTQLVERGQVRVAQLTPERTGIAARSALLGAAGLTDRTTHASRRNVQT